MRWPVARVYDLDGIHDYPERPDHRQEGRGVRIVMYENGKLPGFVNGWLLRSFVPGLIGQVPYVGGLFSLVDILCIFGEERRCIHDMIAGTKVVEAQPLSDDRDAPADYDR